MNHGPLPTWTWEELDGRHELVQRSLSALNQRIGAIECSIHPDPQPATATLEERIRVVLNQASAEGESNTPDFILAGYLVGCLDEFNAAVNARALWHGNTRSAATANVPKGTD